MNPRCPNDGTLLRLVHYRTKWLCDTCGEKWDRSQVLLKTTSKIDEPLLFLRRLFG